MHFVHQFTKICIFSVVKSVFSFWDIIHWFLLPFHFQYICTANAQICRIVRKQHTHTQTHYAHMHINTTTIKTTTTTKSTAYHRFPLANCVLCLRTEYRVTINSPMFFFCRISHDRTVQFELCYRMVRRCFNDDYYTANVVIVVLFVVRNFLTWQFLFVLKIVVSCYCCCCYCSVHYPRICFLSFGSFLFYSLSRYFVFKCCLHH